MHEIQPGLWLGSFRAACDQTALLDLGVTHILSMGLPGATTLSRQRFRIAPSEDDPFTRFVLVVDDATSARLERHFQVCCDFIKECLTGGGTILVHCHAGQSRSPTIVMAYLMAQHDWTANFALDYVRQRRATVQPNAGFLSQLRSLEAQRALDMRASIDGDYNESVPCETSPEFFGDLLHDAAKENLHPSRTFVTDASLADAKSKVDTYGTAEVLAKSAKLRARLGAQRGVGTFKPPSRKQRFL